MKFGASSAPFRHSGVTTNEFSWFNFFRAQGYQPKPQLILYLVVVSLKLPPGLSQKGLCLDVLESPRTWVRSSHRRRKPFRVSLRACWQPGLKISKIPCDLHTRDTLTSIQLLWSKETAFGQTLIPKNKNSRQVTNR